MGEQIQPTAQGNELPAGGPDRRARKVGASTEQVDNHLQSVRERTLLDSHLMRWLHVFWELPPGAAAGDLRAAFRLTLLPAPGESWREKLARTSHSFRHPGEPMSTHLMWSHEVHRRRSES